MRVHGDEQSSNDERSSEQRDGDRRARRRVRTPQAGQWAGLRLGTSSYTVSVRAKAVQRSAVVGFRSVPARKAMHAVPDSPLAFVDGVRLPPLPAWCLPACALVASPIDDAAAVLVALARPGSMLHPPRLPAAAIVASRALGASAPAPGERRRNQ